MNIYFQDEFTTLYHGEALGILRSLPDKSVDVVCTDPPYSSGGMMRSDRAVSPSGKYVRTGTVLQRPDFSGDCRDQRSFLFWATMWMVEAMRVCKPGGVLFCCSDWRQLPTMSDAIQAGGWVWRGVNVWDKTEGSRPQKGWFRSQCEYVLTASRGSLGKEQDRSGPCAPGLYRQAVSRKWKRHITGKPVGLIKSLLQVRPEGSVVLDPFAGSGTTLVAAREMGMRGIGVEMEKAYCDITVDRLLNPEA